MFRLSEYLALRKRLLNSPYSEAIMIALILLALLSEGVGLSMLLPIIQVAQDPGRLAELQESHRIWEYVTVAFGFVGLPVNFGSLLLVSFLFILLRQVFTYARQVYSAHLQESIVYRLRNQTFKRFLAAHSDYHDQEKPGSVANSIVTELALGVNGFLMYFTIASYFLMAIFYLILLLIVSGPVTVGALAVIGVAAFSMRRYLNRSFTTGKTVARANEEAHAFLAQRLRSARLIKLVGAEEAEINELNQYTTQQFTGNLRMKRYTAVINSAMEPIALGFGFLLLYLGQTMLAIPFEEIAIAGLIALLRLLPVIKEILGSTQSMLSFRASLENFISRYDRLAEAAEDTVTGEPPTNGAHELEFVNVSFRYPSRENVPVLRDVTAGIPKRSLTLIIGPSGAGKSTLLDLIPRLRDPDAGDVRFDGKPIRDYRLSELRRQIAYVSQTPLVLNVSVREHISYGTGGIGLEEIQDAARLAGIASFVEQLPDQYDTSLGEEGLRVSGGQRQRLDLARGLAVKAGLVVLDEPTSNLDEESARAFMEMLSGVHKARDVTLVVISHDLSIIDRATHVIVLKDGYVETQGSPEDVRTKSAWYASAVTKSAMVSSHEHETSATLGAQNR